ncbi:MAG: ATP-binding protein [Candidatus Bathyarchaeia archaeon]
MKEIGYIMSGCNQRVAPFVVKEGSKAFINQYYFVPHPIHSVKAEEGYKPLVPVLIRVFKVMPYNPEMDIGGFGPIAGKKGEPARYGKRLEYEIAWAEILGYVNENGKWCRLECSPGTWDPVFEPDNDEISRFFTLLSSQRLTGEDQAYMIKIGVHRGLRIPVFLDLNALAKGHMFISGMTRSGKSTFAINLIAKSREINPKPHFVVFDRRSEYSILTDFGATMIPYHRFLPRTRLLNGETVASRLGVNPRTSLGRLISESVEALAAEEREVTKESLMEKAETLASMVLSRDKDRILRRLDWILRTKGGFLEAKEEVIDIIEAIMKNEILIIDFSVDTDVDQQHVAAKHIIKEIIEKAMVHRNEGDFAVILVIEEVQYLAPEKGLKIEVGNPERIGVDKALVEAISQAGGYNVGFLILTQRPAYASKSIISQCNSVACFRLMSGNDQEAIIRYSEYGNERLSDYLPGLADHEAMVWGIASPVPFPIIVEMDVKVFPRKAGVTAKQAWEKMARIRISSDIQKKSPLHSFRGFDSEEAKGIPESDLKSLH